MSQDSSPGLGSPFTNKNQLLRKVKGMAHPAHTPAYLIRTAHTLQNLRYSHEPSINSKLKFF